MKTILLSIFLTASLAGGACNNQLYRLALNQRSFYNPAALCPYCKGSSFFSVGINFSPEHSGQGDFFAIGCDGPNKLHGPWDVAASFSSGEDLRMSSYSLRYAWAAKLSHTWQLSAGMRFSYMNLEHTIESEGVKSSFKTSFFDADAGVFLTNAKGLYFGLSAQHLPAYSKAFEAANGEISKVSMNRSYAASVGGVIPVCMAFDILTELNGMYNGDEYVSEMSALVRLFSVVGVGGGVTFSQNNIPEYEVRGGITTTSFKFLSSVAFTSEGKAFEAGMVIRFNADRHHPWIIKPITTECTGGSCDAPRSKKKKKTKKDEFHPHA